MTTDRNTEELQASASDRLTQLTKEFGQEPLLSSVGFTGEASFITLFAVNRTTVTAEFSNKNMEFIGWSYGLGFSAGTSLGGGRLSKIPTNGEEMYFSVFTAAGAFGLITIDWWGGAPFGSFGGVSIGAGVAVSLGKGKWRDP